MKTIRLNSMAKPALKLGIFLFPVIFAALIITFRDVVFAIVLGIICAGLETVYIYLIAYINKWCIEFDETHFTLREMSKVISANYVDIESVEVIDETRNGIQLSKKVKIKLGEYPDKVIEVTINRYNETHNEFLEFLTAKTREGVCHVSTISR